MMEPTLRNCVLCGAQFIAFFWNEKACSPICKEHWRKHKEREWRKSPKGMLSRRAARKRYKQRTPYLEDF